MFTHSEALKKSLAEALKDKGANYRPRTRYLDGRRRPVYINRLIREDSPYLLQHAHNPVDWRPWGKAAFAAARRENKPVFLSIGYSTCHWCHVMEEESFDNEAIARAMNAHFICLKVDRELQPDVDTYYMTAVMLMQGQGGWPLSSFLTADGKPFFCGTYYRPEQFMALLERVNEVWRGQRPEIRQQAESFARQLAGALAARRSLNEIGAGPIDRAARDILRQYDADSGGFGRAPKFPNEPYLCFLLEYAVYAGDSEALSAVVHSLRGMSCGGIYDHIGGGFHRYATDRRWLVPHFEKMLYNQANLAAVLIRAWQLTGAGDFKRVASETLDYVMRELRDPAGMFYSATDADSEGEEGRFFIWDKQEIEAVLKESAEEFMALYQITGDGNFEGRNIPNLGHPLEVYARREGQDYGALIERLGKARQRLWRRREKRPPPLCDRKVITAWNGLAIRAFALAGRQLKRPDYLECAIRAARAVLQHNKTADGELSRASLAGRAFVPALQEDYACLAEGLLAIYDATLAPAWRQQAAALADKMIMRFWDADRGGFFMGRREADALLPAAPKPLSDDATAAGNSVALRVLARLARRAGQARYADYAARLLRASAEAVTERPHLSAYLMCGLLEWQSGEQDAQHWAAAGQVYVAARAAGQGAVARLTLDFRVAPGWYLNQLAGHTPVKIEAPGGWEPGAINAPEPAVKRLGFSQRAVRVYENKFSVNLAIKHRHGRRAADTFPGNLLKLKLTLRACNARECLAPETVRPVLIV